MKDQNNTNRTFNSDQYKRDWAYAARALQKGETPEKVVQNMAGFRKDLDNPQEYAEKTVAKVQSHLEVQKELSTDLPARELSQEAIDSLDKSLKQVSKFDIARRLYDDGADRPAVTQSLQQDHRLSKKEAGSVAKEAELRFVAERDLNYAIRARGRGEADDQIIPKIAEYRQGKIDDPQSYARAIVDAADQVREAEREVSIKPMLQQRMEAVQQQYRRDLHHAVFQLENRSHSDVTQEIHERRPEKAYDSPSFRLHGQPDPSYAVAVVQQAERIREVTNGGRKLEDTLDVAQREFARHIQEAVNYRDAGKSRNDVINDLSQGTQEFYARAVVNQAESIRDYQRELSVRPEMARGAVERTAGHNSKSVERSAVATVER